MGTEKAPRDRICNWCPWIKKTPFVMYLAWVAIYFDFWSVFQLPIWGLFTAFKPKVRFCLRCTENMWIFFSSRPFLVLTCGWWVNRCICPPEEAGIGWPTQVHVMWENLRAGTGMAWRGAIGCCCYTTHKQNQYMQNFAASTYKNTQKSEVGHQIILLNVPDQRWYHSMHGPWMGRYPLYVLNFYILNRLLKRV